IGRAPGRERGEISGVAGSLKKKKKKAAGGAAHAGVRNQKRTRRPREARVSTPHIRALASATVGVLVTLLFSFFFFQAEDGIRDSSVTGVQTCALPILYSMAAILSPAPRPEPAKQQ